MTTAAAVAVVVDVRERALVEALRRSHPGLEIEVAALDVADAELRADGARVLVERKTLADLAASIKDGRYAEQKQRLRAAMTDPGCRVVVALETPRFSFDDAKGGGHGLRHSALVSAVVNTQLRDGMPVFQTSGVDETAALLAALARRLAKDPTAWRAEAAASDSVAEYRPCVVKACRRENLDPETAFRMQLCTVPNVSWKTADAIASHLEATSLVALLEVLSRPDGLRRLTGVPGIGDGIARNVLRYLGAPEPRAEDVGDVARYFARVRLVDASEQGE